VRLPRLFRTTSFRLTLLYAGLFSLSVLFLFVAVYWSTVGLMSRQIDETVRNELTELQSAAPGGGLPELQQVVAEYTARSPGFFYLLQDADGRVLAGNLPSIAPEPGLRKLSWRSQPLPANLGNAAKGIRGYGMKVADGAYLFVGLSSNELRRMQTALDRAFLWSLAVTLVLALLGGAAMSLGPLRRIEAISRASRDIMGGDLGRRIALRGSGDEFDRLASSLNAMLNRIQVLMNGLQQVSSDVAHDLRTPLTLLRQRLELARRRGTNVETLHAAFDHSITDIDAILDTFGAILRIAQIESGSRKAKFTRLDLSELLEGLVETYQPVAEEKSQRLAGAIAPGLSIEGDRELLTQLFANLIENAINHAPPGISIGVGSSQNARGLEVVISDSGPGIPSAYHQKVFQRFYRLETSRTSPGNGLGLSLAAAVAELHEAAISLSDNHPGLRVTVVFPAARVSPDADVSRFKGEPVAAADRGAAHMAREAGAS
jgi:signal transduction histidine kinase